MKSISYLYIFFVVMFIAIALFSCNPAYALDNFSQHNVKAKFGNASIAYRGHKNLDKWMTQIDYKPGKVGYAYRYQENKGNVEHRLRLNSPSLITLGNLKFVPRLEYRYFEKKGKDDFLSLWVRWQYKQKITNNLSGYIWVAPKLSFDQDGRDNGDFSGSQNRLGCEYKLTDNVSFGIFGEKNFDDDWNTKSVFLGTELTFKF
jgi:hypothetical protein